MCLLCLFTPFLSALFVSQKEPSLVGGGGGLNLRPNFQKRGRGLTGSQNLKKRGVRTLLPTMKNSSKDSSEQYWDLDKVTKKKHYTSVSITKWFELYLGNRAFFVATAKVF